MIMESCQLIKIGCKLVVLGVSRLVLVGAKATGGFVGTAAVAGSLSSLGGPIGMDDSPNTEPRGLFS